MIQEHGFVPDEAILQSGRLLDSKELYDLHVTSAQHAESLRLLEVVEDYLGEPPEQLTFRYPAMGGPILVPPPPRPGSVPWLCQEMELTEDHPFVGRAKHSTSISGLYDVRKYANAKAWWSATGFQEAAWEDILSQITRMFAGKNYAARTAPKSGDIRTLSIKEYKKGPAVYLFEPVEAPDFSDLFGGPADHVS